MQIFSYAHQKFQLVLISSQLESNIAKIRTDRADMTGSQV